MDLTDLFTDEILKKAAALIDEEAVEILDEVNDYVHAVITDGDESVEISVNIEKMKNNEYDYTQSEHPVYDAAVFVQYCIDEFADEVADYVDELEEEDARVLLTDILTAHPELIVEYGLMDSLENDEDEEDDYEDDEDEEDEFDLDNIEDIDFDDIDMTKEEFLELFGDTIMNPENANDDLDDELDFIEEALFTDHEEAALKLIYIFMNGIIEKDYPDNVKRAYLQEALDDLMVIYDNEEDGSELVGSINSFVDENLSRYQPYIDLEEIFLDDEDQETEE